MKPTIHRIGTAFAVAALACTAGNTTLAGEPSAGKNISDLEFVAFDGLPGCVSGAVPNGDPAHGDCLMYVYADSPFDIHYVDAQGAEIPAAQALQISKK